MPKPELYNLDAESALLGSVLIGGNDVLDYHAVGYVKPSHFFDAKHRLVWQAFLKMKSGKQQIDIIEIANRLDQSGVDFVFLQERMDSCTSFVRADQYATIIIEHAKRRYAEVVISNLGSAVYDNGHFETALNESIEILTRIKMGGPDAALPWDIYTLADAYKERAPLVYVVNELFCLPSLNIVYGVPGCLKSMLLADMALCVAAGLPWLDSPPTARTQVVAKKTVSVPVLWLDFDNGTRRTHERTDALASARNLAPDQTPFYYVSMPAPWLCADDEKNTASLAALAIEKSVGMIVIDNLGTVSGEADENSGDMIQVFANLRRLAERANAAVIVIHHQRKSTGHKSRDGESLRGHSSIEGALDLALLVERHERSPNVSVKSTKTRGVDVVPFGATFAYSHKEGTTELDGARFFGAMVEDNSKGGRARRAIITTLESLPNPPNKGQLIAQAKSVCESEDGPVIGRQWILDALTALIAGQVVLETEAGRDNARLYSLA
jgi:hypothetical protein